MADDIVTRLRYYFPTEQIQNDAADEIDRLRDLCDQLAEALRIQAAFTRRGRYCLHAEDALAKYEARR